MVATYQQWLAAGQPWRPSNPSSAMAAHCKAHGVAYGIIGAVDTHLDVSYPEDHAPYSRSPWPGPQPYPYVLAVDLMTVDPVVARRLIAAKRGGQLPCLKYINWTDANGNCWHTSWQPDEVTRASSDRGHIHCSWRTDHVLCYHAAAVDPFAAAVNGTSPLGGNRMIVMAHERGSNVDWIGDGLHRYRCPDAAHRANALVVMGLQGNPSPTSVEFSPGTLDALGPVVISASTGVPTSGAPVVLTDAALSAIAAQAAATVGGQVGELSAKLDHVLAALSAAGHALGS
jgi:hypothetical protein